MTTETNINTTFKTILTNDGIKIVQGHINTAPFYEVVISADMNDADYQTTTTCYCPEIFENKVAPALYLLSTKYSGSHKIGEFVDYLLSLPNDEVEDDDECIEDMIDLICIPGDADDYAHTFNSMSIRYFDSKRYYNIELTKGE